MENFSDYENENWKFSVARRWFIFQELLLTTWLGWKVIQELFKFKLSFLFLVVVRLWDGGKWRRQVQLLPPNCDDEKFSFSSPVVLLVAAAASTPPHQFSTFRLYSNSRDVCSVCSLSLGTPKDFFPISISIFFLLVFLLSNYRRLSRIIQIRAGKRRSSCFAMAWRNIGWWRRKHSKISQTKMTLKKMIINPFKFRSQTLRWERELIKVYVDIATSLSAWYTSLGGIVIISHSESKLIREMGSWERRANVGDRRDVLCCVYFRRLAQECKRSSRRMKKEKNFRESLKFSWEIQ